MRNLVSRTIVVVAVFSALGLTAAWGQAQPQQQPAQQQGPKWKDAAEYDLYTAAAKEADPKKKLDILNQWKEKYPSSDVKMLRLGLLLDTYRQLSNAVAMLDTTQEILKEDPKDISALYWTNLLVVGQTDPAKLEIGEKAANTALSNLDTLFAAEKRPPSTPEAAWKQFRSDVEEKSHRTLAWVAMQRKNYPEAEKQFTSVLKLNPNDGQAAYWLGQSILTQAKPERQSDALFEFARAAVYEGPGALDAGSRQKALGYITRNYNLYHGEDAQGLKQMLDLARAQALPPADFKILSKQDIEDQKLRDAAANNPSLPFWIKSVKEPLQAEAGAQYFESTVKTYELPPAGQPLLQGSVISQTPPRAPKVVVLGIENPKVGEVTLKLDAPMAGPAEPGTVIKFKGVATGFTREPFMVTFDVEKANVQGWPAPPPPVKKAVVKKAVPKKQ